MSVAFDIDRYCARIRAFDGARFAVEAAATLHHRDRAYLVFAVRSKAVAPKTLLVLAGVHGDSESLRE